jgi:hypothetical protein
MISKRKDPDVLDTSKPILEPPVFPNAQERTPGNNLPSENPDLLRENDEDDTDDVDEDIDDATLVSLDEDDDDDLDR